MVICCQIDFVRILCKLIFLMNDRFVKEEKEGTFDIHQMQPLHDMCNRFFEIGTGVNQISCKGRYKPGFPVRIHDFFFQPEDIRRMNVLLGKG